MIDTDRKAYVLSDLCLEWLSHRILHPFARSHQKHSRRSIVSLFYRTEITILPTTMKTFIALFLASIITTASAYESELSDERRLRMGWQKGNSFEKYLDIYERCCGPEFDNLPSEQLGFGRKGQCKCPVRAFQFGNFDIYGKWQDKCAGKVLEKSSIAALAVSNDDFSTLVSLLQQENLVETLSTVGDLGPFTVFAPTDKAFEDSADAIANSGKSVNEILLYHVVAGAAVDSNSISDGQSFETVNTETVTIDKKNGVKVNGANVILADQKASNGIVHVIDAVLIPP